MSAAWGSGAPADDMKSMWRMLRLWSYVSVGSLFYLYIHFKLGL